MAGIRNINGVYDISTKMVSRKLSFEVGQNFLARVVNLDKVTGEMLLKLLDGWQFSAKLQNPIEKLPEGLIRFVVEGFEDGKLQLKILTSDSKKQTTEKDSINSFLKEKNVDLSDSDYDVLNKMIKHNIPLTKDNISDVKSMLDFMNKAKSDVTEEDNFIERYIQSKNIDIQSEEGTEIKSTLKSFLNELKSLSEDDLLIFFENNIDLTEENIKSFNNVFKGDLTIFKDVKSIEDKLKNNEYIDSEATIEANLDGEQTSTTKLDSKQTIINEQKNDVDIYSREGNSLNKELENLNKLNKKDSNLEQGATGKKEEAIRDENIANNVKDSEAVTKVLSEKESEVVQELKSNNILKDKNTVIDKHHTIEEMSKNIKEQISLKTEELKHVVKTLLEQKGELDPKVYNDVMQALDKNANDFKIFNSISNQYYYLDLPINIEKREYQCKLMIKDERKKGKRIDSTDVRIAASVNTINMGIVDAYIKVNNYNMNLDIKCGEEWIKVLDRGKEKILSKLHDMGYNVFLDVSKREKEMNITNCSDFFDDNNLNAIDIKA